MDLDGFDKVTSPETLNFGKGVSVQKALNGFDQGWYIPRTRRGRWMDLLGDYAGNELFVIDGESLFQTILDNPQLAIGNASDGDFQILHAYHLLEKILLEFVNRSANFEIVFFHKYRHLTLQTGDIPFIVASRTLARTLLFKHLTKLNLPLHVFEDLVDPRWVEYASDNKPMFILMNDGGSVNPLQNLSHHRVFAQRKFVYEILNGQMAMASIKGIVFADSKISTFVFEPTRDLSNRLLTKSGLQPIFTKAEGILEENLERDSGSSRHDLTDQASPSALPPSEFILKLCTALLRGPDSLISTNLTYMFLIHWFHLPSLSVQDRAQNVPVIQGQSREPLQTFLSQLFFHSSHLLSSFVGVDYDFDGRVFLATIQFIISRSSSDGQQVMGQEVCSNVKEIWAKLHQDPVDISTLRDIIHLDPVASQAPASVERLRLMPFNNDIFNKYLPHVSADYTQSAPPRFLEFGKGTVFSDTQHWHNKKSILPPHLGGSAPKALTAWEKGRRLRSNQIFMYNMQIQAATITGASGTILQQRVIAPVGRSGSSKTTVPKHTVVVASSKGGKKQKSSSKQVLLDQIQKDKTGVIVEASKLWWKEKLTSFSKLGLDAKVAELSLLFRNKRAEEAMLGLEMKMYRLHLEIQQWAQEPDPLNVETHNKYSVNIVKLIRDIYRRKTLTSAWKDVLTTLLEIMGFKRFVPHMFEDVPIIDDVKPSFKFVKLVSSKSGKPAYDFMHIKESPVNWQLRLFGEFMDRSMDSAPDSRVPFEPDAWQRRVLDCIDEDRSILVVAPTSAGKTFISFYAMEQVLRCSDDGVLVYVAPTKALVTQITAEIYARFSKQLQGRSCWAIHTRDYRVNDPQKCQILVTVPEVLAIMLLSPAMARSWAPKIKRIILDEIHSIGQQEGGAVWEQILLMAPCPIIGLSATVGSPEIFNSWLSSVQAAKGFKHTFIQHPHRYSHLRKFFYTINKDSKKSFDSLEDHQLSTNLKFLHPIGALSFGRNSIPDDLSLESRDTISLYEALCSLKPKISDIDILKEIDTLEPSSFFSEASYFLRQKDVLEYEVRLKGVLTALAKDMDNHDPQNPILHIVNKVQHPDLLEIGEEELNSIPNEDAFLANLIHLLADLHVQGDLPAIIFNFDRSECEVIAMKLGRSLATAETRWKATSTKWTRKMAAWEAWKLAAKDRERAAQRAAVSKQKKRGSNDKEQAGGQEPGAPSKSWEESFDPNRPLAQFSFINDKSSYTISELEEEIKNLKRRLRVDPKDSWPYDCLRRGVAVHHAGMNKAYRSLVESLFRRGFVRVIVATGTLALGINAPAKTTIFCNDSPFLTALMYRQCAGRAGRRGFDLLGNVVFYGIPMDRVQRLILSKLPTLGGGFPVTSTLVLRLCNLLEESKRAPNVVKAIDALMSLPRVSFASDVGRDHLIHHIRFSIEYLRRSALLNESGQAMNLFAVAGHLYYAEPSNLALATLMRSGALHEICADLDVETAKRNYILLMAHLFGRRYLRKVELGEGELEARRQKYPSQIVLPSMPTAALKSLKKHADEILKIFVGYALAFAEEKEEELKESKMELPLSGIKIPGNEDGNGPSPLTEHLRSSAIKVTARSPFVATSGLDDTFTTVQELADTVRKGIHLNAHAIPCIDHIIAEDTDSEPSSRETFKRKAYTSSEHALNAYLYDFYIHGQAPTLVTANSIRKGEMWYLLEDFRLTLMTVRSALQQLLTKASKEQLGINLGLDDDDVEADSGYGGSALNIEDNDTHYDGGGYDDDEGFGRMSGSKGGEEDWDVDSDFKRPTKVTDMDWRVYKIISLACAEFDTKAKAMWA